MALPPKITANARQSRALTSPIRLEIIGQFTTPGGMSIADVAERMGRSSNSLYYHFKVLEDVGLLRRVGSRPGVKKEEALFEPAAARIELPAINTAASVRGISKTMAAAFRMAQRDIVDAIQSGSGRTSGKHRNFAAWRLHCRSTKEVLAEINEHIRAIERILAREARRPGIPPDADQYFSLTLTLAPLRGRGSE
jgi:AcrR family transcriptional regulator